MDEGIVEGKPECGEEGTANGKVKVGVFLKGIVGSFDEKELSEEVCLSYG